MFGAQREADIVALLDEQDQVRVQLALVKLSEGDLDRLLVWLDEARKDWRDVLMAAEYPRQSRFRGSAPPDVVAADRAEYLAWLDELPPV